jgi:DEAD/DEAH box helicase domain-containing protein
MNQEASLLNLLSGAGWTVVDRQLVAGRPETTYSTAELPLGDGFQRYVSAAFGGQLYGHQIEALQKVAADRNVCLTTGTASGKSAVFYGAAMRLLESDPNARVLAIYPLKALGAEQEDRWRNALAAARIRESVGRIDGSVSMDEGWRILRKSRVIIATPDILHARFLFNLARREVRDTLAGLRLMVIDEVHSYTGVFGSNAAYLIRRIRHACQLLGSAPGFVAASATIRNPAEHLRQLVGQDFEEVGPELDTSRRHDTWVTLVRRPEIKDLLAETADLTRAVLSSSSRRFITFVDSRKLAEMLAAVLARTGEDEHGEPQALATVFDRDVLPYRAGFEEDDRQEIQARLTSGNLRGVIATSALELGIDIGGLDTAILIGVPASSTSLRQRIGRVGRSGPGEVLVISTGSVSDEAVFSDPQSLLRKPPAEGALYLKNRRIQYIHALCLARNGGEHDQILGNKDASIDEAFASSVDWPEGFVELCRDERIGAIPIDLQAMKSEGGEEPNYTFPLRDVESQFKVELRAGPDTRSLGSLSFSQLLREAYPGAIYRYITMPYRVFQVHTHRKFVRVRKERGYFTKPILLPTQVFPNLSEGNVGQAKSVGDSRLFECPLQVRQAVAGFSEQRGQTISTYNYPTNSTVSGIHFPLARFQRNFFTTGVVVAHPAFNQLTGPELQELGDGLFEAFLSVVPFERRELDVAAEKLRVGRGGLNVGDRFIAFFDQTYGSLHLTDRLLDSGVWAATLRALQAASPAVTALTRATWQAALDALLSDLAAEWQEDPDLRDDGAPRGLDKRVRVIVGGSKGLNLKRTNEEFLVEGVFFSPQIGGLAYRGRSIANGHDGNGVEIWPLDSIQPVEGESQMGEYDLETGVITPA